MEIMLLTPSKTQKNEIDVVVNLFEAGLDTLHITKPDMSTRRMKEYISSIPDHFHNRLIIHSHHNLAFKFSLKGIHFTHYHLKRRFKMWCLFQKEKFFRKKLIHTRSYRRLSDVFNEEKYVFDYYLLRNVFNRVTNEFNMDYHPARIREAMKVGKKFVAFGGMNIITAQKLLPFNFYGICLYSYIWKSPNPLQSFIDLKQALEKT